MEEEWLRIQCLRWFGHVLRRVDDTEVGRLFTMEVAGGEGGKISKAMEGYG